MKTIVKIIAVILLLLNGIGALYGGFMLIADPSGSILQMPLSYLEHSPFVDYLIPGIVLFIVNGIFSFVAIAALFLKTQRYSLFVMFQGILLSGWIVVQMILLKMFYPPLHLTFLFLGLCLVGCGLYLKHKAKI